MPTTWTCPHCERPTTISDNDVTNHTVVEKVDQERSLYINIVKCPNPECRRLTVGVSWCAGEVSDFTGRYSTGNTLQVWRLIPDSTARSFPDYIPPAIRQDYEESCRIRDASPKGSATLSRRALQGMIRDFWGIKKGRLIEEIRALPDEVTTEVRRAIDAVRGIGNIGAHMEMDVNLIVDVEPDEAEQLITLNEMLLDEWYVARHRREETLAAIVELGERKQDERRPPPASGDPADTNQ